jgi:broad specificity phosphatase PhoE
VGRGLDRLLESGAAAALLVLHKGTIRAIAEKLLGRPLDEGQPELGGLVSLSRGSDGSWHEGRRSSDPVGLG